MHNYKYSLVNNSPQSLFPERQLSKGIFPSGNFPIVQFPKRQLPKSVLAAVHGSLACLALGTWPILAEVFGHCYTNLTFGKLYIWEDATWEIVTWENT